MTYSVLKVPLNPNQPTNQPSEWLQRLPVFIIDFRGCRCDRIDFCPAV